MPGYCLFMGRGKCNSLCGKGQRLLSQFLSQLQRLLLAAFLHLPGCHKSCATPKHQPKLKEKSISFNTSFSCFRFLHLHLASRQSVTRGHARPAALKCLQNCVQFHHKHLTWLASEKGGRREQRHCTTPARASPSDS